MLEIIKQAYKDVRDRIKNPFTENNATPFAGTFLIVLVLYNWELIFSILNFDRTTTRSQKIRIISEFVNQQDWFTEFKLTISYTLALILFYAFFSNISLIITTFFNSWFKPAILKFIDRNKITTKKEYNDLLAHVDMLNKQLGELEDFSMKSQAKHTMQIEDKDKKIVKLESDLGQASRTIDDTTKAFNDASRELDTFRGILQRTQESQNKFKVLYSRYGASDNYIDVTERVSELLAKNNAFIAENKEMGKDPIDKTVKELIVVYQVSQERKTLIVNEDEKVELKDNILINYPTDKSKKKQMIKKGAQFSNIDSALLTRPTFAATSSVTPIKPNQNPNRQPQ